MLCGCEQNNPYLSSKYWLLFALQSLRPPMDFHLTTSMWLGILFWFLLGQKKETWENAKRIFPSPKRFCWCSGWRVIKWIATFVFGKNFSPSPPAQKFGSRESACRARSEAAYPSKRPNSLIASKKQLFSVVSRNIHSPSLWTLVRYFHFQTHSSFLPLGRLSSRRSSRRRWNVGDLWRWWCVGVERATVEYRASAERPLRKAEAAVETPSSTPPC